jgi:hypothetical protein
VDIRHRLKTLTKKPGAVKNSRALKSEERLKAAFDGNRADRPKDFIALLRANARLPLDELAALAERGAPPIVDETAGMAKKVEDRALAQLSEIAGLHSREAAL